MRTLSILAGLAAALLASPYAMSEEKCAPPKPGGSELQLFIENDLLAHTDRYYTNGIKFGIVVPGETLNEILCKTAKVTVSPFWAEHKDFHYGRNRWAGPTRFLRSEEFYTARGGGGRHIFDSLNLGFEFSGTQGVPN